MTDPSALTDVKLPDPSFMDDYDTGGDYTPPPQPKVVEGGKTKRLKFLALTPAGDKIKTRNEQGVALKTAKGYFKAIVHEITLVESGYVCGQTHVGTEQYDKWKNGVNTGEKRHASPMLDYFHAFGMEVKPTSVEEYETYLGATAERQLQVTGDWSAYDKDTQTEVAKKWEDFPLATGDAEAFARLYPGQSPEGKRLPYIERGDKRFWARLSIKNYVSAI